MDWMIDGFETVVEDVDWLVIDISVSVLVKWMAYGDVGDNWSGDEWLAFETYVIRCAALAAAPK